MWLLLLTTFPAMFRAVLLTPCAHVTHSECGHDSANLLKELDTPDVEGCHHVCWGVGHRCNFFIFDRAAFGRGNCRIYSGSFSSYILHCNALGGSATELEAGCDLTNPEDGDAQILRGGNCDYGRPDETFQLDSWQHCRAECQTIGSCYFWQFTMEHKLCTTYSREHEPTCSWHFAPREPSPWQVDPQPDDTKGEAHQEL